MPAAHDRGGWPDGHPHRPRRARIQRLGAPRGRRASGSRRPGHPHHQTKCARAIESLPPEQYETLSYYEKWTAALEILLIEKGILTAAEIDSKAAELREQGL